MCRACRSNIRGYVIINADSSVYVVTIWTPHDAMDAPILGTKLTDATSGEIVCRHGTMNYFEGVMRDYLFPYFDAAARLFKETADIIDDHGALV